MCIQFRCVSIGVSIVHHYDFLYGIKYSRADQVKFVEDSL